MDVDSDSDISLSAHSPIPGGDIPHNLHKSPDEINNKNRENLIHKITVQTSLCNDEIKGKFSKISTLKILFSYLIWIFNFYRLL